MTRKAGSKGKEVELKRGVRKCLAQQRSSLSEACASAEFHEAKREAGDARLANSGQLAESCKDELVGAKCLAGWRDEVIDLMLVTPWYYYFTTGSDCAGDVAYVWMSFSLLLLEALPSLPARRTVCV